MSFHADSHRPSAIKDLVLRPFRARFSTVTAESKKCSKGIPQPVSGYALISLSDIVESPISQILIVLSGATHAARNTSATAAKPLLITITLRQIKIGRDRTLRYGKQFAVVGLEISSVGSGRARGSQH